ncbi:hypothetical protein AX17_004749, partial [Amanita inopinata Kibby_2008]
AAATILVFDYFLTLEIEISLMWNSPWTPTKILFLLTRYLPFIDVPIALYHQFAPSITANTCVLTYQISGWMFASGIIIAEIILTIRTWALWGKDWRLSIALPIFSAACFVPTLAMLHIFLDSLEFTPQPIRGTAGCFVTRADPILSYCYVLLMVYETGQYPLQRIYRPLTRMVTTGILILMSIRAFISYRRGRNSELLTVIYRDGISYYIYLFLISVINVTIILSSSPYLPHLRGTDRLSTSPSSPRYPAHPFTSERDIAPPPQPFERNGGLESRVNAGYVARWGWWGEEGEFDECEVEESESRFVRVSQLRL